MEKVYDIILNTDKDEPVFTGISLCQGDSGQTLNIRISDFDTTNTTASIVFKKDDGNVVHAEVSATNGIYKYVIRGTELQKVGKVVADIKFYDSQKHRISSSSFVFHVTSDTMNASAIESGTYSDVIDRALTEFNNRIDTNLEQAESTIDTSLQDKQNQINNFVSDAQSTIDKTVNNLSEQTSNQIAIGNELLGSFELESDAAIDRVNKASEAAEGIVLGAVPVATKYIAGSVKGDGNVEIESDGDMWADPYKDKGTATGTFINFKSADDALAQINAKGITTTTPTNPNLPISPDNKLILSSPLNFDLVSTTRNIINIPEGLEVDGANVSRIILLDPTQTHITVTMSKTLKIANTSLQSQHWIVFRDENNANIGSGHTVCSLKFTNVGETKEVSQTVAIPQGARRVVIFVNPYFGMSVSSTYISNFVQVEYGSVATPYTPYKEDRVNIPLDMGEWNDIKDGQYIKGAYEYTITGDENWNVRNSSNDSYIVIDCDGLNMPVALLPLNEANKASFCTHFKLEYIDNNVSREFISHRATGKGFVISILRTRLPSNDLAGAKAYLKSLYTIGNPVVVRYKTNTQTNAPLNTYLKTFKGTTNIFTTANPQVELTATFKSQLWADSYLKEKAIESKFDKDKVINNLLGTDSTMALSAPMGKQLKSEIDAITAKNPTTLMHRGIVNNRAELTVAGIYDSNYLVTADMPTTDQPYRMLFQGTKGVDWNIPLLAFGLYSTNVYYCRISTSNGTDYESTSWVDMNNNLPWASGKFVSVNLNNYTTVGIYIYNGWDGTLLNKPIVNKWGTFFVSNVGTTVSQTLITEDAVVYSRKFEPSGGWEPWKNNDLSNYQLKNGTGYLSGTYDLNTFKDSGRWTIGTLTGISNAPSIGTFIVDNCGIYVKQTITNYGVDAAPKMFVRTSTDGGSTWKPWYVFTGTAVT